MSDTAKMRRPKFATISGDPSGRVAHDDRGTAVWEWAQNADPLARLEHSGLALADGPSTPSSPATVNKGAAKSGYSPYESGVIEGKDRATRRDLRALSKWIQLRKQCGLDTKE